MATTSSLRLVCVCVLLDLNLGSQASYTASPIKSFLMFNILRNFQIKTELGMIKVHTHHCVLKAPTLGLHVCQLTW
jgi:hypothetical protein